jgi:hypothetical protein
MSHATHPLATRLGCESLEQRENPVGNVTAMLSGGTLTVVGDAFDNAVSIRQSPLGDITIVGLNGTTVNGRSAVFVGRGLLNGLNVNMGGGNDAVEVVGLWVWGAITVEGGAGNDTIRLAAVTGGSIAVDGGPGNDTVIAQGVVSRTTAVFNGGLGFDTFVNRGVTAPFRLVTGFERFL